MALENIVYFFVKVALFSPRMGIQFCKSSMEVADEDLSYSVCLARCFFGYKGIMRI